MIVGSNILAGASGQGGGYLLQRSVRLRSSASAYFNRTLTTPTNNLKWTWSAWVKRGTLGTNNAVFYGGDGSSNNFAGILFTSSDTIQFAQINSGTYNVQMATSAVFRDPSAWYHVVIVYDSANSTSTDGVQIYINGVRQTVTYTTGPFAPNTASKINSALGHYLGKIDYAAVYFDAYTTEFNFIDGQALTPTSFGEYNTITGVWQPKKYGGTYGTNGFYLNFNDNSAATAAAIGKDLSGNGNNFTPNNISLTAGATYDSMTDVPTLTSPTTANYCVGNPLNADGSTWSNANLNFSLPNSTNNAQGTLAVTSGKYYWEVVYTSGPQGTGVQEIGLRTRFTNGVIYSPDGSKYINGTNSAYGATYTTGDVIGVALDMTGGTVTFYKNNTSQGAISISGSGMVNATFSLTAGGGVTSVGNVNFGQRPFTYTPPTGFVAFNTYNLPTPTISNGATQFAATTYPGNGSTQNISNAVNGISMQPDFVWIKGRSGATDHQLLDSVRTATRVLVSNSTAAEVVYGAAQLTFNANGFGVGGLSTMNTNAATYVGWQWKASNAAAVTNTSGSISSQVSANPTAGFSVVTWTGNGSPGSTVGHGLGIAPKFIISKYRSIVNSWLCYSSIIGAGKILFLNQTNAATVDTSTWNNTAPTNSVFTVGSANTNQNTGTYVAYCFSEIAGYSKFNSYTGNGSTDGTFVYTGFRPRYIMIKRTDTADNWVVYDTSRSTFNESKLTLYPNLANAESADATGIDILSNGFKMRNTFSSLNVNGGTYLYAAFAENPTKLALAR